MVLDHHVNKTYLTSTKKAIEAGCVDKVESPSAIAMRTHQRVDGGVQAVWVSGPSGGVREC